MLASCRALIWKDAVDTGIFNFQAISLTLFGDCEISFKMARRVGTDNAEQTLASVVDISNHL